MSGEDAVPQDRAVSDGREPARMVEDFARQRAAIIEQACEGALQTGVCGVLVLDGDLTVTARPDLSVPYGEIHFR